MTQVEASVGRPPAGNRIRGLMRRAAALEIHMYASIGRAIMRRPAVSPGAKGFRYDGSVLLLLIVLAFVSAIEVVAIDLIVHRWLPLRIGFLVIGIWGAVWMIGLLCAHVMRPHTIGPDGVRVRDGLDLDVGFSWDDIYAIGIKKRSYDAKPPRVLEGDSTRTLVVAISKATNIEVRLEKSTAVRLPGDPPKGGEQHVTAVRLWVDEPRAFLGEAKKYL